MTSVAEQDAAFIAGLIWDLKCDEHEALAMEPLEAQTEYCISTLGPELFTERLNESRSKTNN